MTAFADIYPVVRALLGDRQVHGLWNYDDASIDSTLRAVLLLGRGPDGYALDNTVPSSANGITPDLRTGDDYALVAMEAALMMIVPDDGAFMVKTRSLTVRDMGDRRKGLIDELRQRIYMTRDGNAVFATYQSLVQFFAANPDGMWGDVIAATTGVTVPDYLGNIVF